MDLNPVGIHFQRRQARHICSIQDQTTFQAPSGAVYAAPTGLGNWVARVATKISLRTERRIFSAPNLTRRAAWKTVSVEESILHHLNFMTLKNGRF
jgi:hypothetical protein